LYHNFIRHICVLAIIMGVMVEVENVALSQDNPRLNGDTIHTDKPKVSPRQRRRLALNSCKDYEGKLISYYAENFLVKNCQRIPLSHKEFVAYQQEGRVVKKVEATAIAHLPLKDSSVSLKTQKRARKKALKCSSLNGKYVAYNNEDVYLMESCRLRRFPDWLSYTQHRRLRGHAETQLVFVEEDIFVGYKTGTPMASLFKDQVASVGRKALSRNQACRGLEGSFVLYYSQMYKVERCQKRQVDPVEFSRLSAKYGKPRFEEHTSQMESVTSKDVDSSFQKETSGVSSESSEDKQAHKDMQESSGAVVVAERFLIPEVVQISTERWLALPLGKAYRLTERDFLGAL